jgi:hypothetical protein
MPRPIRKFVGSAITPSVFESAKNKEGLKGWQSSDGRA